MSLFTAIVYVLVGAIVGFGGMWLYCRIMKTK